MGSKFKFDRIISEFNRQKDNIAQGLIDNTRDYFVKQFDKQSDPDNSSWPELSAGYSSYKSKKYPGKKILVADGDLRKALVNSVVGKKWNFCKIEVNSEYASYHNDGTGNMKKRTFIAQSKLLESLQVKVIEGYINKLFKI